MLRKPRASSNNIKEENIILPALHKLSPADISLNAKKVLNKLNEHGYCAYLVGGGVRDLLVHKKPKDFDIATNATPNQIKKIFRNARIIGRRFKLAHIIFHREIIEVATFRGNKIEDIKHKKSDSGMLIRDNVFGSIDEDAIRRDLTINSLYYNLQDNTIVDLAGGFQDLKRKQVRIIGDPQTRYTEDPVRMLRVLRFAAKLNFDIEIKTKEQIRHLNNLIKNVSNSRMFDEVTKLYHCGNANLMQKELLDFNFFQYLFPQTHKFWHKNKLLQDLVSTALANTDSRINGNKPVTPAFLFAIMLWFPMLDESEKQKKAGLDPLPALDKAMSITITEQNRATSIPKRYTQAIREIWILQYRFTNRSGNRAFRLIEHPRFRAAYDFLALRALAGDADIDLANWWTTFQELDNKQQLEMVNELPMPASKPRRRRRSAKK